MSDIDYSLDALNTLSKFYRVKTLVYVEGDEDIVFWKNIFGALSSLDVEIQSVGGANELDKYINVLIEKDGNFVAARDADYLQLLGLHVKHPRVIYTFGHSIENTIYNAHLIAKLVGIWCKAQKIESTACSRWLNEFVESFVRLLAYDVASRIQNDGVLVLGDNCSKFMESEKSAIPDKIKIAAAEAIVSKKIKKSNLKAAEKAMHASGAEPHTFMRGHFLASGVIKYISDSLKKAKKNTALSQDALYSSALAGFDSAFNDKHPHYKHYERSIKNIEAAF